MECRYCLESGGELITPCECKTPVHHICLVKWIETSHRVNCEICNHTWGDTISKKIEKARLIFNLLKAASFVIVLNIFWAIFGLKIVAKWTFAALLTACVLNVCGAVVFVPFIIIQPFFAPVSMLGCLFFLGKTCFPLIEQYL